MYFKNLTQPFYTVIVKELNDFTLVSGKFFAEAEIRVLVRAMSKTKAKEEL